MSFRFSQRSLENLCGVHPDLKSVVRVALEITEVDFMVIEGLRSIDRQKNLFRQGATRTMKSRHLTGHAVDVVPWIGGIRWDWPPFYKIADAMKAASENLEISVDWGGDWRRFKDGPHWQLSWKSYPGHEWNGHQQRVAELAALQKTAVKKTA